MATKISVDRREKMLLIKIATGGCAKWEVEKQK